MTTARQRGEDLARRLPTGFHGEWLAGEPLSRHVSFRIGGPTDLLVFPRALEDLALLVRHLSAQEAPYFVLGEGTNLLVRDGGVRGVVLHLKHFSRLQIVRLAAEGMPARVLAGAGVSFPRLAQFAGRHGLTGLEFAIQIPGSVGGAVLMNAGIPGRELRDVLESATLVLPSGLVEVVPAGELGLGYRSSRLPARAIVAEVALTLSTGDPVEILRQMGAQKAHRVRTQPKGFPNAGSIYKNPPGDYAGRLIEAAGLKGRRAGGAVISDLHANFILNAGNATASDVLSLMALIEEEVERRFGVRLEREIKMVGEDQ
ncbi:MAG: UDP-N-acetylmuramate dehydrogenase [Nitrospirae bacterium]|nr:UDP-N-acetylmuramate dehydrogenase [Nitrospirota bacterium]